MAAQCCTGEGLSGRLARRLSGAAASLSPGAVLVLLPKCPLCLAAWLTVATGVAIPAAVAASVRGLITAVWIAAVAFAVVQTIRRRASRRSRLAYASAALKYDGSRAGGTLRCDQIFVISNPAPRGRLRPIGC
jgi:hypothetical protein